MKNQPVIINSDHIVEGLGFTDTSCGYRTAYLDIKLNYEPAWGSLFGYSKQVKSWTQMFDFHYWSFDGDNLVDSYSSILSQTGGFLRVKKPSKYTYKLLHHSDFDFEKTPVEMWKELINGRKNPIVKELNRCYSPEKYDLIYIEGIFHDRNTDSGWLYDKECEELYENFYETTQDFISYIKIKELSS